MRTGAVDGGPRVRPLRRDDRARARALVDAAVADTPYATRLRELLEHALTGADDETRGLVVEENGEAAALALHGVIAGAAAAARLFFLSAGAGDLADDRCAPLLEAVRSAAVESGAHFLVAELPDDEAVPALAVPLRRHGFVEVGRVADYFRDGVDLLVLRLSLEPTS